MSESKSSSLDLKDFESIDDDISLDSFKSKSKKIDINNNNINDDQDSFQNNLDKLYEDHKKNNNKASEIQNPNRPISSYQRILSATSKPEDNNINNNYQATSPNIEKISSSKNINNNNNNNNKEIQEMSIGKVYVNPNNVNNKKHTDIIYSGKMPLNISDYTNTLSRLNVFLKDNSVKIEDLFDNLNIFIDINELRQIFKNIDFVLSYDELDFLFEYNNPNLSEGYLSGKTFLNNFKNYVDFDNKKDSFNYENNLNKSNNNYNYYNNTIHNYKKENRNNICNNKSNKNEDNKKIQTNKLKKDLIINNNLYKNCENEVLEILKNEELNSFRNINNRTIKSKQANIPLSKNNRLVPLTSKGRINNKQNNKIGIENNINKYNNQRPLTTIVFGSNKSKLNNNNNNIKINNKSKDTKKTELIKKRRTPRKSAHQLIKETLIKKKAEDELMKLSIDKRDKEFERDCIIKMNEANSICEKLNVPVSYTVYISDDHEGNLMCRLYNRLTMTTSDINLKQFMFDYKKLKKQIKIKQMSDDRKEFKSKSNLNEDNNNNNNNKEKFNMLLLNKNQRQEEIKRVLKESIILKMQLKSQLCALREKEVVDKEIIDSNIKLTNLNINEI